MNSTSFNNKIHKKFFCHKIQNVFVFGLFLNLFFAIIVIGQPNIAELKIKIARVGGSDTQKLKAYEQIFKHFQYSNTDSASYYVKQGLTLFTSVKFKPGIASMLTSQGGIYVAQGMYELAKVAEEEALEIFAEIQDQNGIANANNLLGVIAGKKNEYNNAVKHFLIAMKIFENIKDTGGIINTFIKLGVVNQYCNNFDIALDYYKKGLEFAKNKPINTNVIYLNNNIGAVYTSKGDYINSIKYIQTALDQSDSPTYARIHMLPLSNMGLVYKKMHDSVKALSYYLQAKNIADKEKMPEELTVLLVNMANITSKSNPLKAIEYLKEALQISKETGLKKHQTEVLETIAGMYKEKGNYKEAYSLLVEQKILLDSIYNSDKANTIANLESLYERDKLNSKIQKLELTEQKDQQNRTIAIVIAILLAFFLLVVIYLYRQTKQLNKELSNREKALQKSNTDKDKLFSIIGHDLIGPIANIPVVLALCRDENMPKDEKDSFLHLLEVNAIACQDTLLNLLNWGKSQMKGILINKSKFNVNEVLANELQLISISAEKKHVEIKNFIVDNVQIFADQNHFRFIVRNLLSNAVKYSLNNGCIELDAKLSKDNTYYIFSVKDNGVGIDNDKKIILFDTFGGSTRGTGNETGNGIGLRLCKEFVIQNGGKIWVESEMQKGSIFYFTLKVA